MRWIALALCAAFSLIGLLPLALAGALRTDTVRDWASRATTKLLHEQLGVSASYELEPSLWPLQVSLTNVQVLSSNGELPVLTAPRLSIRPRLFSLLSGRLDPGHIDVEAPHLNLVVRQGKLQNLPLTLPARQSSSRPATTLSSLAITDASIRADIDGTRVETASVDLDVFAAAGSYEVALRAGTTRVQGQRHTTVDDDVLCQIDARLQLQPQRVLVRRLSLHGAHDVDPLPDTTPECNAKLLNEDPRRVLMRLSGLSVSHDEAGLHQASGHVLLRVPARILERFGSSSIWGGWVGVSGDVDYDRGRVLPDFHGKVRVGDLKLDRWTLVGSAAGEVHVLENRVLVPDLHATYGDAEVVIKDVQLRPLQRGLPLQARTVDIHHLGFPSLMKNLGVTPNTIVQWDLDHVRLDSFQGTLSPLHIDSELTASTHDFEIFDVAYHRPTRSHMLGVKQAQLSGSFGIHEDALAFEHMQARFGGSSLTTDVYLGYDSSIRLKAHSEQGISLADLSPLTNIEWSGRAVLDVAMQGSLSDPTLGGSLSIEDFHFAGFPLGDFDSPELTFRPLSLHLPNATLTQGASQYELKNAWLKFDTDATLEASAAFRAPRFTVGDFFHTWHFDQDPRWAGISGRGSATGKLKFVLGGPRDRCGTGDLRVNGHASLAQLILFDEVYQNAGSEFDFHWFDVAASYHGMRLSLPALRIDKGSGALLGSMRMTDGAQVRGELVATGVPISQVQALSKVHAAIGFISGRARVSGSVDALQAKGRLRVSPVRVGQVQLAESDLSVELTPVVGAMSTEGRTKCGGPMLGSFNPSQFEQDKPSGVFHLRGQLFGGQIRLDDLQVTRQRDKHARGAVTLDAFQLDSLLNLSPSVALMESPPRATLSGTLQVQDLPMQTPGLARAELSLNDLSVSTAAATLQSLQPTHISIRDGKLAVQALRLRTRTVGGQSGILEMGGSVDQLSQTPNLNWNIELEPTSLEGIAQLFPSIDQATGSVSGSLSLQGPLNALKHRGRLELTSGSMQLRNPPLSLTDVDVAVSVIPGELIIDNGAFSVGGGRVKLRGNAPLSGFSLGEIRTFISAEDIELPLADGVRATVGAELQARWNPQPDEERGRPKPPRLLGNVTLDSFTYSRPVKMSANITELARPGRRTEFDAYQPEADLVSFDVNVSASQPLRLSNNLIDASLTIENEVLRLAGTNQRFGVQGSLRIAPGGQFRFNRHEFEIQQGRVRFNDPTRIAPLVDVTAITEYRRYNAGSTDSTLSAVNGGPSSAGEYRVTMHAHGDAEKLKVDLSSQPALSEVDIVLLLTLGLTRAELDQATSSIGEGVALEALGALTGADQVVKDAIPVIDEFRFGTIYSSRTRRTEPSVTIGKRLSNRIRAYVTSGVNESRDVRSNVQIKLNRQLSVEGSYDNVNDLTSSSLGNIGADIRWRLDFE